MRSIRVASKGVYADARAINQRVSDGKPGLHLPDVCQVFAICANGTNIVGC
jgi:hypothetical protein